MIQNTTYLHYKKKITTVTSVIFRLLIGILVVSPILLGISYSLRTDGEIMTAILTLFPKKVTAENYEYVFRYIPIGRYMVNSFINCAIVIAGQIIFCSLTAFVFVFYEFKGKTLFFNLILVTMMIPGDVTLIANYLKMQDWGLTDRYAGMTLPFLISGMGIFMMRQFFLSLPKDFKEAATLDGCSTLGFYFRIALPLSLPSLVSLALYEFVIIYNQYLWPLLIANSQDMYTIQIGMAMLKGAEVDHLGVILAGAIICIVPVGIVFTLGQKYIVRGMVAGGIKG